ncbi:MAG: alpha/beta hydrolase [Thiohalomonadales bacterium]
MKPSIILSLLLACISITGHTATIKHALPNGFVTSAEYRVGKKTKPAVFILHGFLQTRDYLTVESLITAISDEGYTVLAPNLSLGISNRKKSLPCEAIHQHNMSQDIDEIDYWVKWLEKKGHSSIYLVGHSFGSLQILVYTNKKKPKSVKKLITASLIDVEKSSDKQLIKSYLTKAQEYAKNNDTRLHEYPISYCKKYISPAKDYISYARWDKQTIISELNKLNIPISVILGSKDIRVDKNWISLLKKANLNLIIIQGANHFFDTAHEFDLNDKVLNELISK